MKCPLCRFNGDKASVITHIGKKHKSQIPPEAEGDPAKFLFYTNHGRMHGYCQVCGAETEWNDKTNLPHKLCGKPECSESVEKSFNINADRKFGKGVRPVQDIEHQRKMQQKRSTPYKFKDGRVLDTLSKDEYKFLSFNERFFNFTSKEILRCPYVFEYEDDGKIRQYDPDFYLIDFNLIVEIKAENNTNPAYQKETGYKVKLKADAVQKDGRFNYIIIYGSDYTKFIQMLYDIKEGKLSKEYLAKDPKKKKLIIHNESISFLPQVQSATVKGTPELYLGIIDDGETKKYLLSDNATLNRVYHLNSELKALVPCSIHNFGEVEGAIDLYRYTGESSNLKDFMMTLNGSRICVSSCPLDFIMKQFKNNSIFIDIGELSNNSIGENDFHKTNFVPANVPLEHLNIL